MFTILIADDEPLAQVGLKSMLDWEAMGAVIVGSSPNGAHALEAIKRLVPDIVIVDVRMPIIDGITLIERCRAEMERPPEFIVLSGHADFDYARRAMRSGVVDYLVKLELDEKSLRESVEKAMTAVLAKRDGSPPVRPPSVNPFEETALARFLTDGVDPTNSSRPIPPELAAALHEEGRHCAAAVSVAYQHEDRLSDEERERTYRCVLDTIKQVAGREAAVRIAPIDAAKFAVMLSFTAEESTSESAEIAACAAMERAREPAERYFGVTLRVGIGPVSTRISNLPESYRAAAQAAATADVTRPVVKSGQRSPGGAAGSPAMARAREDLIRAVDARSADLLRSAVDAAVAELDGEAVSAGETLAACCDLLYAILDRLDGGATVLDSLFPEEAEGYRLLFSAGSAARMRLWLLTVRDGLAARFESNLSRGRNPLVAGVREYVLSRWREKISLPDTAAHFHVSPNHLSSVFKKYNGTGFVEFVSEVKVEKAKGLIVGGRYKMYEIAQLLAYEDAYYFSKVFKKVTGMSPREYHLRYTVMGNVSADVPLPALDSSDRDAPAWDKKTPIS